MALLTSAASRERHDRGTVLRRRHRHRDHGHDGPVTSSTLPRSVQLPPPGPGRSPLLGQAARFLLVGGIATLVDVGLFNLLHYGLADVVAIGPLTAKVVSTVVAGVVAFVGNRQWSFAGAGGSVRLQVTAFVAVNAAALLLSLAPLALARYVLGLTGFVALNLAGNVVGLAMATVFRFWGYRRWVFPDASCEQGHPVSGPATAQECAACERESAA